MNEENLYNYKAELLRVIDGDTIEVQMDLGFNTFQKRRVRILGFNAAETRTKDLKEKAIGFEQKLWLSEKLISSEMLYIKTKSKDNFGRYLGEVYNAYGENISELFLKEWPERKA